MKQRLSNWNRVRRLFEGRKKAEALPRPTRPPPWKDKFRACQSGAKSEKQSHNKGESMLWLASSYVEHEATIQEGVKKFHLCLSLLHNSLWEALEMKAHSEKFKNVSDAKVIDDVVFCPPV